MPEDRTLRLTAFSFSYRTTLALDDVSLTIPEGTVTTRWILQLGQVRGSRVSPTPFASRVDVRIIAPHSLPARLLRPQDHSSSLRDNIALRSGASDSGVGCRWGYRIDDRFCPEASTASSGEDAHLSGQARRIAIARPLVDAPILVLDEATASPTEAEAVFSDSPPRAGKDGLSDRTAPRPRVSTESPSLTRDASSPWARPTSSPITRTCVSLTRARERILIMFGLIIPPARTSEQRAEPTSRPGDRPVTIVGVVRGIAHRVHSGRARLTLEFTAPGDTLSAWLPWLLASARSPSHSSSISPRYAFMLGDADFPVEHAARSVTRWRPCRSDRSAGAPRRRASCRDSWFWVRSSRTCTRLIAAIVTSATR